MKTTLVAKARLDTDQQLFDDQVKKEAVQVLEEAHDRKTTGFLMRLDDGTELELPAEVTRALVFTLHGLTQGEVSMRAIPDQLTTSTAASILGVSRPTLMKLIASNELPSTKIGTHHRLKASDIFALKEKRAKAREKAFNELREMDLDFNIE